MKHYNGKIMFLVVCAHLFIIYFKTEYGMQFTNDNIIVACIDPRGTGLKGRDFKKVTQNVATLILNSISTQIYIYILFFITNLFLLTIKSSCLAHETSKETIHINLN